MTARSRCPCARSLLPLLSLSPSRRCWSVFLFEPRFVLPQRHCRRPSLFCLRRFGLARLVSCVFRPVFYGAAPYHLPRKDDSPKHARYKRENVEKRNRLGGKKVCAGFGAPTWGKGKKGRARAQHDRALFIFLLCSGNSPLLWFSKRTCVVGGAAGLAPTNFLSPTQKERERTQCHVQKRRFRCLCSRDFWPSAGSGGKRTSARGRRGIWRRWASSGRCRCGSAAHSFALSIADTPRGADPMLGHEIVPSARCPATGARPRRVSAPRPKATRASRARGARRMWQHSAMRRRSCR